jgi:F-type H+-transporting ATPase subunit delta
MRGEAVAGRYARALFESITDRAKREQTAEALTRVAQLLSDPAGPRTVILNPFYSKEQRSGALEKLIKTVSRDNALPPVAARFFELLLRKNRLDLLGAMAAAYSRLLDEEQGRIRITVSTATPLDRKAQQKLHAQLEQALNRSVGLACWTDPALLGGARLQLGSRLIDATLRGQLDRIRQQVLEAR